MATLLDHRGFPIKLQKLNKEIAAPALGDVNSVWGETITSGLNPISMSKLLEEAARGFPDKFFGLAQEMEERDLHYASVLATRKRAITGIEPIVIAAGDDKKDEEIASAVSDMISQPHFIDNYLTDALDALGKGYSIVEIIWETSANQWRPKDYKWRDQRHFVIDKIDGRTVRLKDKDNLEGIDLPPFQFSVHQPKLKSGLPIRGGLGRLAAWAFLFKSYTLKDWMAFLEVYGMPLRVGKFGRSASHDDKRVLLQAVRDISSDAAAIIPKGMEIEFIEAGGGRGNAVFSSKAEYLDKQVSKAVLGQTMSTDDGASRSQAEVHDDVRHDIARADGRQITATINRDLVRPFVDLNYGMQERYPTVIIPISENENIEVLVSALQGLVPLGLQVSMSDVRKRIGFEDPNEDDTLLAFSQPIDNQTDANTARAIASQHSSTCTSNHALPFDNGNELDALIDDALSDWQADLKPILTQLETLFNNAQNYEAIANGLDDLIAKLDVGPIADRLAKLAMKARGLGDISDGQS